MRSRVLSRMVGAVLGTGLLLVALSPLAPPALAAPAEVTFNGHGFGHGRGMGQWGSYGYAVDLGWDHPAILDHYYGGTVMGAVGNGDITVELLAHRGTAPAVTGPEIHVNGVAVGAGAIRVRREAAGQFAVDTAAACAGPWTNWSGVLRSGLQITSTAPPTGAGVLKVCEAGLARGYRGALQVVEGPAALALVNRLPVEDYLLGVVPREMPASWGSAGGGRGMNPLRAQAVAARSYSLAGGWSAYARTCDTTSCQVYGGTNTQAPDGAITSQEHPLSNQAVWETAGQVRLRNGALVRTEYSASTGGWTVGGEFPAVEDEGDATGANPHHNWTKTISADLLAQRLGTAPITGITVVQRNGLGAEGGRVLQVAVDTTAGRQTLSGTDFRARAQLRSDWFSVA
jgi:SpoIID/LytB domain protein